MAQLRYKDGKGTLEIVIGVRDDTSLVVTIRDNGVGRRRSQELKTKNQLKQKSKGMSTIKKRISFSTTCIKIKFLLQFQIF